MTNQAPLVSITSPVNGSTFTAGNTISVAAKATDPDGKIVKVSFYQGTTLINTQLNAPYEFDWTNVPAGDYRLEARALDNSNVRTISSSVNISIKAAATTSGRSKYTWPFSASSIWNMPIGSKAVYSPANMILTQLSVDQDWFFRLKSGDPLRTVMKPGAWGSGRCNSITPLVPELKLPIPDDLIVPDSTSTATPNNAAAFLMPDGKTLVQVEPLARCIKGGNIHGWRYSPDVDIYGLGHGGAHFGSALSSIGGTIRKGELLKQDPIRHAIKLDLNEAKYLYYSASSATPGYRWPATKTDSNASTAYKSTNPKLVMGTLLAVPPGVTEASLALVTLPAKKFLKVLQDYGAYIVDSSGWDCTYICMEEGAGKEFADFYGYTVNSTSGTFFQDMAKIFKVLHIVDNNSSSSIGGGGVPRAPLAPPIID